MSPRGEYGTLMLTMAATRSGASRAMLETTIEPQSWPTNVACSWPRSSSSPRRSSVRWTMS
jgi:hypothetical protein